tara:strand:- start:49 stop:156 length:108 start_codon:yes stop_codon:yes gene_type:complete
MEIKELIERVKLIKISDVLSGGILFGGIYLLLFIL